MNGGDANFDGSIDAFDTITWELQNGLFDDYSKQFPIITSMALWMLSIPITWELNNGKFEELD